MFICFIVGLILCCDWLDERRRSNIRFREHDELWHVVAQTERGRRYRGLAGESSNFYRGNARRFTGVKLTAEPLPRPGFVQVYPKIMDLNASVEDPRIMGVIREQGGKVKEVLMGTWGIRGACLGYLFMFYVSWMSL